MKTIKEIQSIIGGNLQQQFSYVIDKDRWFYTISFDHEPSIKAVKIALDNSLEFRLNITHKQNDKGEMTSCLCYYLHPIGNREYEWVTE